MLGVDSKGNIVEGFNTNLNLDQYIPDELKTRRKTNIKTMQALKKHIDAIKTGKNVMHNIKRLVIFISKGEKSGIFNREFAQRLRREI